MHLLEVLVLCIALSDNLSFTRGDSVGKEEGETVFYNERLDMITDEINGRLLNLPLDSCRDWSMGLMKSPSNEGDTSQGNQDGVLRAIFAKIGSKNKKCVEFGFGYGDPGVLKNLVYSDLGLPARQAPKVFSGLNTQGLVRDSNWNATFFDAVMEFPNIQLRKKVLTRNNIASAFAAAGLPRDIDYISIDVDSIDVWLFLGLLSGGYRPRVVSVEYNPNFDVHHQLITCEETWHEWTGKSVYGASAGAINLVATMFGYRLITVVDALDLFFVDEHVLTEAGCDPTSLPHWVELVEQPGRVGKRMHMTSSSGDVYRLVDFPLALMGEPVAARKHAIQEVHQLNLKNKMNPMSEWLM
jgi:hypothetical protein